MDLIVVVQLHTLGLKLPFAPPGSIPNRDALRQAHEKLLRHGFTGVFHAVFSTSLFVQRRV